MSERGYRRLFGFLLLWAVLPLPFTRIVQPPFWLTAIAAAMVLLLRPGRGLRLKPWVENLLGVLILVAVVAAGGMRVGPLRPLGHLLLLLTATRAVMVGDRRTFVRALPALALVWVVSVTSSTHVTSLLYLGVSACLAWWMGMRLFLAGVLEEGGRPLARGIFPRPRHAIVAGVVSSLLAVPVFVTMPRLRTPWIAAGGGFSSVSGFSSTVELSTLGRIEESPDVALVIRSVGGDRIDPSWARLRASAFDLVATGSWRARWTPRRAVLRDGRVWLRAERLDLEGTTELVIDLFQPRKYLFVPENAVAIRCAMPLAVDDTGAVVLNDMPSQTLRYRVWVATDRLPRLDEPTDDDTFLPDRNQDLVVLADQVAGESEDPGVRAAAVERYLHGNYRYSLAAEPRSEADPVAWFLLERREGHCEFFAASMVVLLRLLDVPARMVGGYSGGTVSPSGEELLVKQANAHTWVEVWLGPDRGWTTFDPTPVEAVPRIAELQGMQWVRWLWDQVQIFWDRHILTFGFGEQVSLVRSVMEASSWVADTWRWSFLVWTGVAVGLLAVGVVALRFLRGARGGRRRRGPAAAALARLARRLESGGVAVPPGATVRWIGRQAAHIWPTTGTAVTELVDLAEAELYAGGGGAAAATDARRLWGEVRRKTRGRSTSNVER